MRYPFDGRVHWRATLIGATLICAAAMLQMGASDDVSSTFVETNAPALGTLVPESFASWRKDPSALIRPISPSAARQADQAYAETLESVYVDAENRRVMLSITWGSQQGDRLQAHRPEFCYQAQGFSITGVHDDDLLTPYGSLPVRRLETRRPGRSEPVSYWMTVGDQAALPGLNRKLAQLHQGFLGRVPHGFLVRVSSITESGADAFALHDRFIVDLAQALGDAQLQRLFGRMDRPEEKPGTQST